jgi:hypothetical protein
VGWGGPPLHRKSLSQMTDVLVNDLNYYFMTQCVPADGKWRIGEVEEGLKLCTYGMCEKLAYTNTAKLHKIGSTRTCSIKRYINVRS